MPELYSLKGWNNQSFFFALIYRLYLVRKKGQCWILVVNWNLHCKRIENIRMIILNILAKSPKKRVETNFRDKMIIIYTGQFLRVQNGYIKQKFLDNLCYCDWSVGVFNMEPIIAKINTHVNNPRQLVQEHVPTYPPINHFIFIWLRIHRMNDHL